MATQGSENISCQSPQDLGPGLAQYLYHQVLFVKESQGQAKFKIVGNKHHLLMWGVTKNWWPFKTTTLIFNLRNAIHPGWCGSVD